MSITPEFLKYLGQKLKSGSFSSININALPQNYRSRVDLFDFDLQKSKNAASNFLDLLHNKANFKFKINFSGAELNQTDKKQASKIENFSKSLDAVCWQNNDNKLESGNNTFGFGYPLLLIKDDKKAGRVIKAPLLIWKLEIEKSLKSQHSWEIIKEDSFPIAVNEVLISKLIADKNIRLESIPEEFLDDSVIQKEELLDICNSVLTQFGVKNQIKHESSAIEKSPTAEKAKKLITNKAHIQWSGVFGIYKSQKQSIVREIKYLTDNFSTFEFTKFQSLNFESKISAVETDPSQENIVNLFGSSEIKVIQGPPGTGKSQSISAILTNALANNKTCLVICEKKAALDVIYNNLEKLNIGSLCAVIDDINKDRGKIISSARSKLQRSPSQDNKGANVQYANEQFKKQKISLNTRLKNLQKQIFGDYTHKELTGLFLQNHLTKTYNFLNKKATNRNFKFTYAEFIALENTVNQSLKLTNNVSFVNSGLDLISDSFILKQELDIESILHELQELEIIIQTIQEHSIIINGLSGEFFNAKAGFSNFILAITSVLSTKQKAVYKSTKIVKQNLILLNSKFLHINYLNLKDADIDNLHTYQKIYFSSTQMLIQVQKIIKNFNKLEQYRVWKTFLATLPDEQKDLMLSISQTGTDTRMPAFFSWYYFNVLSNFENSENIKIENSEIKDFEQITLKLKEVQKEEILKTWQAKQKGAIKNFQKSDITLKRLYNYRKNKNFGKKNALRKIINTDFKLFTSLFPVILTNPVSCSSVLPLEAGIFDIVIFDEASQLRIEDTFPAYLRGKYKVISGDRHQMPPSSYFLSEMTIDNAQVTTEEAENAVYLAESESLLEYAEENTFEQTHLSYHYRSQHPFLIDFSNSAFYGDRLIPMPAVENYKPIRLINVDGLYKNSTNEKEALEIVSILKTEISPDNNGEFPSVGVVTTNLHQRNFILETIQQACIMDAEFAKKFAIISTKFFVKNLENIQGDERDIIIISTTFGLDENENFRQNFGPINSKKGYRLLNVVITRAKKKLFVCTSVPRASYSNFKTLLHEKGNVGRGIFYAYLAYAESIEQDSEKSRQNILSLLSANCQDNFRTHSATTLPTPFESVIKNYLTRKVGKRQIHLMYKHGGFVIDIFIEPNNDKQNPIAIECNGGQIDDFSVAYTQIVYRKNQIERFGFKYINIWSWQFLQNPQRELKKLDTLIKAMG